MPWFFTVVLIATCAGTLAVTGYLLYRLFTTEQVAVTPAVATPVAESVPAAGQVPAAEPSAPRTGASEPSR